ncbi:MAG: OmpA family protein [Cyclobacteriaceae bacterium]
MRFVFLVLATLISSTVLSQSSYLQFYGEPQPLDSVNTAYDENFISLNSTESKLIFYRKGFQSENGINPGDLWMSNLSSYWESAEDYSVDIDANITPLGFVNGGTAILYNKTYFDNGVYIGEIWMADLEKGVFSNHREIDVKYFKNISDHQSGSISFDGRHIVLAMEGTTTYGVEDLYVIHMTDDGKWGSPRNLGYRLNTAFQEYSPFLAADNETLIFATNGRGGSGSFDLFMTKRLDDSWQNWSEPVNLGPKVNTSGAEKSFAFIPGSDFGYFTSTTNSDGYGDIKRIRITSDIEQVDSIAQVVVETELVAGNIVVTIVDAATKKPISGEIRIGEGMLESAPLLIDANQSEDITINTHATGYMSAQAVVTISELQGRDTISIELSALEVGTKIQLKNVLFYQGTANFIEGSSNELDRVVEMMKENEAIKIELRGHTDNRGNAQLNQQLSQERVLVVQEYLEKKGVSSRRISGKGFGGSDPIASNDTEPDRKLNRRVEFVIVSN